MIKLEFYKDEYKEALLNFHLDAVDKKYTALPSEALEITGINPNRNGIVILKDKAVAGFFVLHRGEEIDEYVSSKGTLLIRALSINSLYHRQGVATKAMLLLDDFIKQHYCGITRLALAVNLKNPKATQLYYKVGFIKHHKRMGKKGEQMVLTKNL